MCRTCSESARLSSRTADRKTKRLQPCFTIPSRIGPKCMKVGLPALIAEIQRQFGPEVARLVDALTERPSDRDTADKG